MVAKEGRVRASAFNDREEAMLRRIVREKVIEVQILTVMELVVVIEVKLDVIG